MRLWLKGRLTSRSVPGVAIVADSLGLPSAPVNNSRYVGRRQIANDSWEGFTAKAGELFEKSLANDAS